MLKRINRKLGGSLLAVVLAGTMLLVGAGCDELFDSTYTFEDWGDPYGGGYDNYDSNWYTDSYYNGDDEGFYIAGDGFSYISGW